MEKKEEQTEAEEWKELFKLMKKERDDYREKMHVLMVELIKLKGDLGKW